MPRDFKPSSKSQTPSGQAEARLRYIKAAVDVIGEHVKEEGEVPPWVLERIHQAAQLMGMAVSYVSFAQEKKYAEEVDESAAAPVAARKVKKPPTKRKK